MLQILRSLLRKEEPLFSRMLPARSESAGARRCSGSSSKAPVLSIGTHDGNFHCDEVLACVMLKFLPQFYNAQIIRTRDEEILKTCDIVVDVGSIYDPSRQRFDHHQKSFSHSMSTVVEGKPWTTKLSSAGLVYAHFGRDVLSKICNLDRNDEDLEKIYDKVYEDFIQEIDAIDNGISMNEYPMSYKITTGLSSRVSYLNPSWKEDNPDVTAAFETAMELVKDEFTDRVDYYCEDWLEGYNIVREAVNARFDVDPSGEIVEFKNGGVPWKDHLSKLEVALEVETPIQFVIFPDGKGKWRVQAVPIEPKSFILRTPLKTEWQGLRGKELEEISEIPTIDFVHATGFIGGAAERDCAIKMAKASLRDRQP